MRSIAFAGKDVAVIGQGTWYMGDDPFAADDEIRALCTGLDLGMTVIDTAEMYGNGRSESLVGRAIAGRRQDAFLVSKVLPQNASRSGTIRACESSLRRLGTDWLDLYLLHWSGPHPVEETVAAMEKLLADGKIRAWGVSNMDVDEMEVFHSLPANSCATDQVLYALSRRGIEYDLLPWCRERAIPLMAYSPLDQGRVLREEALGVVAKRHGVSAAQVALAWVVRREGVLAIPKAASEEHARENAAAMDLVLGQEDLDLLDAAFPPPNRKMGLEML